MSTLETARRRGLGTALTARLVHDAAERGWSTTSLQSTAMAERVRAAVAFALSAGSSSMCRSGARPWCAGGRIAMT
jgi:hypothetical protein